MSTEYDMNDKTILKYLQGRASEKERGEVLLWVDSSEENRAEFEFQRRTFDACLISGEKSASGIAAFRSRRRRRAWIWSAAALASAACLALLIVTPLLRKDMSVQTVVSPLGQQTRLSLSDGTSVWLNSNSELTFGEFKSSRRRLVSLKGEAYFEVSRDEHRPFIVRTSDFDVKVLGTKFNVNSYGDTKSVVLVEGSVKVLHGNTEYAMAPGERFRCNSLTSERGISKVETDNFISWINGYLDLKTVTLEFVFDDLQSFFGAEFNYDRELARRTWLSGKLELREGLEDALKNLQSSALINYKFREDGTVDIAIK